MEIISGDFHNSNGTRNIAKILNNESSLKRINISSK